MNEYFKSELNKKDLIIAKLIKPTKGHKTRFCRNYDLKTDTTTTCTYKDRCYFAHELIESD